MRLVRQPGAIATFSVREGSEDIKRIAARESHE